LALALPAQVPAATTIGSNLAGSSDLVTSCLTGDGNCTLVQTALPGRQVTSPLDGVVVRWRVKAASSPGPVHLRVVRAGGGAGFTGVDSQETAARSCPDICTVDTRLRIKAGDYIGVDAPAGATAAIHLVAGANLAAWSPFLGSGETRAPNDNYSGFELLMNADVEADADGDGFGDETQDLCRTRADPQRLAPCRPPTIRGRAQKGRTLTAVSHVTGSPSSSSFRWLRCTRRGGKCARITGSLSGARYKLKAVDIGHRIRVKQKLTSSAGTASSLSAPSPIVQAR
jgi:hypothetical protein